jgi:hypothetical protein
MFIESSAIRSKSQPRPCVFSGKFSANKLIVLKKAASRTAPLPHSVNSTFIDWGNLDVIDFDGTPP